VAASVFYKRFIAPIEAVINANNDVLYQNVDAAQSYGAELEARFALPLGFRVGANLSLIRSRVDFDSEEAGAQTSPSRPLQGQSPYVGNVELGYTFVPWKSDLTLLYNVLGERISEAGIRGSPDVYEQPFHRLDFTYSQKLPESLLLKLSAINMLNQRVQFKQGEVEVLGYDPGVAFLASMEWSFDR
jgi:outer membrane receptor protein involved in Fe transport